MIYDILNKYRYVREYRTTKTKIKESTIHKLLEQTWKVTPSKNNFMPYKVHVLGPSHQIYKNTTYLKCLKHEGDCDGIDDPASIRYSEHMPNYANILTCSHLLIFTLRVEHDPNPFQKWLINRGHNYPATNEETIGAMWATASLEIGMFSNTLKALCLEQNIDVAFVGCFPSEVEAWADMPFIKRPPLFIMTLGKGKVYRQDIVDEIESQDYKPGFEKVMNFIGEDQ